MKYIMVGVTDEYDYDIHDDFTCSTLKALQRTMENYLRLEEIYPRFTIEEGNFHDGLLQVTSIDCICTYYEPNENGVKMPILRIIGG